MVRANTSDKILDAAMGLFSEKGYKSVTTKEIAREAGVCEMTIFRHFESKQNLFERAFDKYVFSPTVKNLFKNKLEWNLHKDLMKISEMYHYTLCKNEKTILMQLKNNELTIDLDSPLTKFPDELRKLLVDYFIKMKDKGVTIKEPEILAVNFLAGNFGIFTSLKILENFSTNVKIDNCIDEFVSTFVKGISV